MSIKLDFFIFQMDIDDLKRQNMILDQQGNAASRHFIIILNNKFTMYY